MTEIVSSEQDQLQKQIFRTSLIDTYIAWIDRTEKTTHTYTTNLKQFIAWLKFKGITYPERQDIVSYRQWLTAEHDAIALDPESVTGWRYRTNAAGDPIKITCKPNTIAQYLRSVTQFFRWTAANNLYPDIAANIHPPKLRTRSHRKDYLAAKDVLAIERSITEQSEKRQQAAQDAKKDTKGRIQRTAERNKRLNAIYLLAVNAGLRTIEISRANVRDFETKGGKAWLYVWGKGHAEPDQKKALAPEVAAAIRDYLDSRNDRPTGSSPLFVATGNRSGGKRLAPTTISTMLKQAMRDAGYNSERITAHSLRHSAAQAALQASGGNVYTAQMYLRHSSPATTEIYLHEDERTETADMMIAQGIYDLYHRDKDPSETSAASNYEDLEQIIRKMDAQQVEQLTAIAAAMIQQ